MINKLSISRRVIVYFLIFVFAFTGAYSIFKYTTSQVGIPFGGKVLFSVYCSCSGNFLLTVSPPVGGQFVYYPGTQAYLNYNLGFMSGMWALGLYSPGGVCMVPAGKGCVSLGVPAGTITPTVGTSLLF